MHCILAIPVSDTVGLEVTEVAHDYQPQIQKFLEKEIQRLNSFDTWHGNYTLKVYKNIYYTHIHLGTKNVAKIHKKVCGNSSPKGQDLVSKAGRQE